MSLLSKKKNPLQKAYHSTSDHKRESFSFIIPWPLILPQDEGTSVNWRFPKHLLLSLSASPVTKMYVFYLVNKILSFFHVLPEYNLLICTENTFLYLIHMEGWETIGGGIKLKGGRNGTGGLLNICLRWMYSSNKTNVCPASSTVSSHSHSSFRFFSNWNCIAHVFLLFCFFSIFSFFKKNDLLLCMVKLHLKL